MSDHGHGAESEPNTGSPLGDFDFDFGSIFADGDLPRFDEPQAEESQQRFYDAADVNTQVIMPVIDRLHVGDSSWHEDGQIGAELLVPVKSKDGLHTLIINGGSEPGEADDYEEELAALQHADEGDTDGLEVVNGHVKISEAEFHIETILSETARDMVFAKAQRALTDELVIHRASVKNIRAGYAEDEAERERIRVEEGLPPPVYDHEDEDEDSIDRYLLLAEVFETIQKTKRVLTALSDPETRATFIVRRGTRFLYETDGQYEATGDGQATHEVGLYECIETDMGLVEWQSEPNESDGTLLRNTPTYSGKHLDTLALMGNVLLETMAYKVGELMLRAIGEIRANPVEE